MSPRMNTALAACAALIVTLGSIGAIVTVPSAEAAARSPVAPAELA